MKKYKAIILTVMMIFALTACGKTEPQIVLPEEGDKTPQSEANAMWDRIPMVRVNDKLYYDTGRESAADGHIGNMDGEITSTVDGSEIPMENNQSNFGTGFGYQYGTGDTIEVYMNEKWFIFEYREETEYPSAEPFPFTGSESKIYTDSDMQDAVSLIMAEFNRWEGCEMHSMEYAGDEKAASALDYCNEVGDNAPYDEAIVFLSNFHSPKEEAGAWNPDEEYTNWQWFLARKTKGNWELIQWGY